jgi:cytochrome bd ubiquinol oxidase subunit II
MTWYLLLGVTLSCYLALAGADHGVAIGPWSVRLVRPYFLGNQVWIVATIGVLIAAFPAAEGELLSGYYAPVATLLAGLVLVVVSLLLDALRPGEANLPGVAGGNPGRLRWTARLGGLAAAGGMGWLLAALLLGAPSVPAALLGAPVLIGLVTLHGAAFAGWRTGRRPGWWPLLTGLLVVLPVPAVGWAGYPDFAGLDLPVSAAVAGPGSLSLYAPVLLPAIPLLLGVQALGWWLLRSRAAVTPGRAARRGAGRRRWWR